ncbi:glucose-6-phosphate dehydrogenase [Falsibacillus albus]|uniref:Glucose-6-phosphate 1-dehydrogenase n=1 Tax=Falsibacillus albus TaxID=2478915 RepID=A0A3L7K0Q8_9BACI|nr:glucose-6-phosphate dehydrogenase [Falsibacillus albus]RLQ96636.1 glucose-6-phosphate dehydrogenase [Falsibacillus albus]
MDAMTFVLFGATGDLAKRKIYPALYNLFLDEKLPSSFSLIGLGRREISNTNFQKHVEESIQTFSRRSLYESEDIKGFLQAFRYESLDVNQLGDYERLRAAVEELETEMNLPQNRMFYLSVAPDFFEMIAINLHKSGLSSTSGWKRLIIEKPFGRDLASARHLNATLSRAFEETEIFRIDHYLGKPMVQNLEALEFGNPVLKALWNKEFISNVQITASETVGVEDRAGYYDQSGVIRDMVQNHMMQLFMMTAMQPPASNSPEEIRKEKSKVMEALRTVPKEEMADYIVRGQYESGEMNGHQVPGYTEEHGVSSDSMNNTFMAARLLVDNPYWEGVPFYIRTGKRMTEKSTKIVIEFKQEHKQENLSPNLLVITINPNESVTLTLNSKNPLNDGKIEPIHIGHSTKTEEVPEAYERLIFDAMKGDATFFAHWNEVELSWKWIQPILEAFDKNALALHKYPAGSMGPDAAEELLKKDGFNWW